MTRPYVISPVGLEYCSSSDDIFFDSLVDKQSSQGLSFKEITNAANFTNPGLLKGLFSEVEERYWRYVDILFLRLNAIHGVNYSKKFWTRSFSLGLMRLITNLHQKFVRFEKFTGQDSFTFYVLDKVHYIIPGTFESQRDIFTATPIGREQLFSIYLKYLRPNAKYSTIEPSEKQKAAAIGYLKSGALREPTPDPSGVVVGIMGSYFAEGYFKELALLSSGRIQRLSHSNYQELFTVNREARLFLGGLPPTYDRFDEYFFRCIPYLFPAILLEGFSSFFKSANRRLSKMSQLKFLVSEAWLSHSEMNLFRSIANELFDVKTLYNEHNALYYPFATSPTKFISFFVDKYLTIGWKSETDSFIPTASLFPFKFEKMEAQYRTLYISYPMIENMTLYSSLYSTSGYSAVKHLEFVESFFSMIPESILQQICYREYPKDYPIQVQRFDKEQLLNIYIQKMQKVSALKYHGESCKEQMAKSNLVIIDSLSTSYLEALQSNIPLICFWNPEVSILAKEHENFFSELLEAQIVHCDPKRAAAHFLSIFENPLSWWSDPKTQKHKDNWLKRNMSDPRRLIRYLLMISGVEGKNDQVQI